MQISNEQGGVIVSKDRGIEDTISGIVIPVEWDDDDDVIGVAIQTSDEEEYRVDGNKKGRELLDLIEQEVEVSGMIREDEYDNFIIKVNEYSLI